MTWEGYHVHRVTPRLAEELWGPHHVAPYLIDPAGHIYSRSADGLVNVACGRAECEPAQEERTP